MKNTIIVRGAGDLATGVIQAFYRAGWRVLALEADQPLAIRRTVALCCAVWQGEMTVEDVTAVRVDSWDECKCVWNQGRVPVMVDPKGECIAKVSPVALVDAIISKRNTGTNAAMAPAVVALGPGFTAPGDAHVVIETVRGHDLGRLIFAGGALPNTGVPGEIGGRSKERVVFAPAEGSVERALGIGRIVRQGDVLCVVGGRECRAAFDGVLRGMIKPGVYVPKGMKIGDVDPRIGVDCRTISDKARCLGGAALQAVLYCLNKEGFSCAAR